MKVYGHLRDQHSVAMAQKVTFSKPKANKQDASAAPDRQVKIHPLQPADSVSAHFLRFMEKILAPHKIQKSSLPSCALFASGRRWGYAVEMDSTAWIPTVWALSPRSNDRGSDLNPLGSVL
jgi:hypothetical protein